MYHKLSIEETIKALDVNPETGLSDKEAALRIAQEQTHREGSSFFRFAARSISRPVVLILLAATVLSALLGKVMEAGLIAAVILIHILLTARSKSRAKRSLNRSIRSSVTHAIVLRNSAKMKVASDRLVVGDVVTIKPGRVVPADLRLISSDKLIIDESMLTGRKRVEKDCEQLNTRDVPIEERDNCVFEGTVVLSGRGDGVVIATGMSTEMSRRTLPLDRPEKDESPAFSKIEKLTGISTVITLVASAVVFVLALAHGLGFFGTLVEVSALAVAVIPESFGSIVLIALSREVQKLKKDGFSVKDMRAAESLGKVNVFTTDIPKMGVAATYTNGRIHTPQEEDSLPFLDGLYLCKFRNPSIHAYAARKCADEEKLISDFPLIGEISGEVTTTLHRAQETTISYTAGEPLEILRRSVLIWDFGRVRMLTDTDREEIHESVNSFLEDGYSITALGLRSGDDVPCDSGLVFLGIVATRAEVSEATTPDTDALSSAGVQIYLLTESDAAKARLGASALSLPCENIICGRELASMSDMELSSVLANTYVFASLLAQDKVRIINILKANGNTVASIGDEISDAPALEAADVGLSDLHAQDVTKEAADVIFDGTVSADCAITAGKVAHCNIRRAIAYLCSANMAELIAVLLSVVCGFSFPLSPLQILLVNLITDTFPVFLLARGKTLQKTPVRLAFVWGALLGIAAPVAFKILTGVLSVDLAQWSVFALLVLGELLLAIPMYFVGRRR